MIDIIAAHHLPAALSLLPPRMDTPAARRMLLAIGLQESGFRARRQQPGPARGFWQFELSGAHEVMRHPSSARHVTPVFDRLVYPPLSPAGVLEAIEHNAILAAAIARLALWRHPDPLPEGEGAAWAYYERIWAPGKPRPLDWPENWAMAARVAERHQVLFS